MTAINQKTTFSQFSAKVLLLSFVFMLLMPFTMNTHNVAFANEGGGDNAAIPEVSISNGKVEFGNNSAFKESGESAWTTLLTKYRGVIVGVSGVAAITMVVIFVVNFLKLGASATNPQARSQALAGLMWSGIAAAGLGAVSLIVGIFYNAI